MTGKQALRFLLVFTGMGLFFTPGFSQVGYPIPSQSTDADYYVSWKTGNDSNPGTLALPLKTPDRAIDLLKAMPDPSGMKVLIRGGTYRIRDHEDNRLNLSNLHGAPGNPIEIRGYPNETVLFDSFLSDFDPLVDTQMDCGWGGISFNESSHILVENFQVTGRCQANVGLINSSHITIRFIEAWRSNQCGLFTGGTFHHLTIEACKFYEQIYGSSSSHGIYISGGSWDPDLPPVHDVTIRYVESYYNGRHGIQLNGRIENVTLENNVLHHNILGGISLIGVRKAKAARNLIYKNNKQGIILYTYFDTSYWDPNDPESVAHWKKTHWTIEEVELVNNTIFMDDGPWYDDQWIQYDPKYHAGILITDTSGLLPPYQEIGIHNNLIYNHSTMMINVPNPEHFQALSASSNFFYSEYHPEGVFTGTWSSIEALQFQYPGKWQGNLWGQDPRFMQVSPTQLIDRTSGPVDFSKPPCAQFDDDFHLEDNSPAWQVKAGAFVEDMKYTQTFINISEGQSMPPGYGWEIARFILNPLVKPEVLDWFINNFNDRLTCLIPRSSLPSSGEICFRNPRQSLISYAVMNSDDTPLIVQANLQSESGKVSFPSAFGISFNANLDIKFIPDIAIIDDTLKFTFNEKSLGIIIVSYDESL